jgi:hypothetical protein
MGQALLVRDSQIYQVPAMVTGTLFWGSSLSSRSFIQQFICPLPTELLISLYLVALMARTSVQNLLLLVPMLCIGTHPRGSASEMKRQSRNPETPRQSQGTR